MKMLWGARYASGGVAGVGLWLAVLGLAYARPVATAVMLMVGVTAFVGGVGMWMEERADVPTDADRERWHLDAVVARHLERDQTDWDALEGELERVLKGVGRTVEQAPKSSVHADNSPVAITARQLLDLPGWARVDAERERLRQGLPPRDPLTGLPPWAVRDITAARDAAESVPIRSAMVRAQCRLDHLSDDAWMTRRQLEAQAMRRSRLYRKWVVRQNMAARERDG